jgi:hypothetical protein
MVHGWVARPGAGKDEALNDLSFDIHLGGRAAKPVSAEAIRELGESDLALLATERDIQPTHVQRLTSRHHALARCIATGMSATEAALCTGYTASRISVMKDDPAFNELIAFYQSDKANLVHDLADKMAAIAKDTADTLHERLTDAPESFSNNELQKQLKIVADRTGHGPASRNTNVNINMNLGDRLKVARERAASASLPASSVGSGEKVGHAASPPLLIEAKANVV